MRSSVVVISSVNASFNAISRNARVNGRETESYLTRGPRLAKVPPRVVTPQSYEEFPRMARHSEVIDGGDVAEQVPFPRSNTTSRDPSVFTNSGDVTPPVCATNAAGSATDVAPQEGIFMRCFSFLQNMGVSLIMPPYAADEELNNIISGELGNINLNSSATKIPLV